MFLKRIKVNILLFRSSTQIVRLNGTVNYLAKSHSNTHGERERERERRAYIAKLTLFRFV